MNLYEQVLAPRIKKNLFRNDTVRQTSFKIGQLIPTTVMDIVPGDDIKIDPSVYITFAPLIAPPMIPMKVKQDFYVVTNRSMWPEFDDWFTEKTSPTRPYFEDLNLITEGSLGDYFGLPTDVVTTVEEVNAYPINAYIKIFNYHYRDQNLQTDDYVFLTAGENANHITFAAAEPRRKAWRHDRNTSALPFAQVGDAVTLPLLKNGTAPVVENTSTTTSPIITDSSGTPIAAATNLTTQAVTGALQAGVAARINPNGNWVTNVVGETTTISTLRNANAIQAFKETLARVGRRINEYIKGIYGVDVPDYRLEEPEFIGRVETVVNISEVVATAQTGTGGGVEIPLGEKGGHGVSYSEGGSIYTGEIKEHGWLIGLLFVEPEASYQQGIDKKWFREDPYDYHIRHFENIGEQEILFKEVAAFGTFAENQEVWGYTQRYSEYKGKDCKTTGSMRSTLDHWSGARVFSVRPPLNGDFVELDYTDIESRIFAVPSEDTVRAYVYNRITSRRPMQVFGIPSFMTGL